jgi:cyclopropane fatty-acyl-phospholipid synthase-like methyltransferase
MDYKSYVGNPKHYDLIGKIVFDLLLKYGLKPEHKLLDIGCGSLRIGKLIITASLIKPSKTAGTGN